MRSLQEWTQYLEQQEQALLDALSSREPEVKQEETPVSPPAPAAEEPESAKSGERVEENTSRPAVEQDVPAKVAERRAAPTSRARVAAQPREAKAGIKQAVRLRKRLPARLNAESLGKEEVGGDSGKTFKETREELIQRLLDPVLNLEEVARILNVCPTTVRRYTNHGLLRHHRTAGNQRRFRLSDVLGFLEGQSLGPEGSGGQRDSESG